MNNMTLLRQRLTEALAIYHAETNACLLCGSTGDECQYRFDKRAPDACRAALLAQVRDKQQ